MFSRKLYYMNDTDEIRLRHSSPQIISAQSLPKPRGSTASKASFLDPYVVIQVFGIPADCKGRMRYLLPVCQFISRSDNPIGIYYFLSFLIGFVSFSIAGF